MPEKMQKVKVLRTTVAGGKRIVEGAIETISAADAVVLIGMKKVRKAAPEDKHEPVEKKAGKKD